MESVCPCCGGTLADDRLVADLNTNSVGYRGQSIEVRPPRAMELVYVLARAWPATVTLSEIGHGIWGSHEPDDLRANIGVLACLARRDLKPMGVEIENVQGRGYRLTLPDQQLATYAAQQRRTG